MPLELVRNDITKMNVDAIVNAANSALQMGSGVCGAIFSAAGEEKLQAECNRIGHCDVGEAVITKGYALPAKYIIHTVGPMWHGGDQNEEGLLHSCYYNSLTLALKHRCSSVALPLISSGIYGYPKDQALRVALSAIGTFLMEHDNILVYLVVYDKDAFTLSDKLFRSITEYIDDNYVEEHSYFSRRLRSEQAQSAAPMPMMAPISGRSLKDVLGNLEETFTQMLLRLIDEKGRMDVEVYKRANIDRKLFSKIKSDREYKPRKATVLAFAIALELSLDETVDLLRKAGYALSRSSKFDVIIEYFIMNGEYDIYLINESLFAFDQTLLGA